MPADSPSVRLEHLPPIAEIVLNKPKKRNALSVGMWAAIPPLVEAAVADPAVKVLIVHGGSAGAFAAGADISEFATIYADDESAKAAGAATEPLLPPRLQCLLRVGFQTET